jgi:hypothetical protein
MKKWVFRIGIFALFAFLLFGLSGRAEAVLHVGFFAYLAWRASPAMGRDIRRLWAVGKKVGKGRSFANMKGGDL